MSSYRKADFQDPTNFSAQLAAIFEQYDLSVILSLTDPRNPDAIQRRYQWPPSLREIADACDGERERQHRLKQKPLPKIRRQRYEPRNRANLIIDPAHPKYPDVYRWTQSFEADPLDWKVEDGKLWIALNIWESHFRQKFKPLPKAIVLNDKPAKAPKTDRGLAMTRAWLDRSDPAARQLSGQEHRADRERRLAKQARESLVAEFGQAAFDAVPDQPQSFRRLP
jgi:hypothetical protein